MECLVDLQYLWMLKFAKKQWLFAVKVYFIYGKKISMHLSRYENNLIDGFVKNLIFENYAPLRVFLELCELCTQRRIMQFCIRT